MPVDAATGRSSSGKITIAIIAAAMLTAAIAFVSATSMPRMQAARAAAASKADAMNKIAGMPLYFERNDGRPTLASSSSPTRAITPCS